jgi:hypothetical protein
MVEVEIIQLIELTLVSVTLGLVVGLILNK